MEKITVEVVVDASLKKTWECFTEPAHIIQWNHASPDWHCPRATNDLRVGGVLSSRMESVDGTEGFDFTGTYTEVIPYTLIAYKMEDGREVRVGFTDEGSEVRVMETFDPESENPIEMQREGWQSILNNFKAYTDALSA